MNTPNNGVQPQAVVDSLGVVHLIYLYGDPAAANIAYVRKGGNDQNFSTPIPVNSPGSAIAVGTVRGAHIALGKSNRIHVAWNGSSQAQPRGPRNSEPMLYTRMNEKGDAFEAQRSLMTVASGLDGGGALAADTRGNVYVTWHAQGQGDGHALEGEGHRRVWMARSTNDGHTFEPERAVSPDKLGACGCCGMGAIADSAGNLYLLYRTARETVHRDMYLLVSRNRGATFEPSMLHPWQIAACPMSTVSLASLNGRVLLTWETDKQVYFATFDSRTGVASKSVSPPGMGNNRKLPSIALSKDGTILLVWTEGTGWKRGGSVAWQVFDQAGRPTEDHGGSPSLPVWNFAAAIATKSQFLVLF